LINNAKLNINTFGPTKYKNKYWVGKLWVRSRKLEACT